MRAWLSSETGSGTWVTALLDVPAVDPDTGETQTTYTFYDERRPLVPHTDGRWLPLTRAPRWSSDPHYLVIDVHRTTYPDGIVMPMGNPAAPGYASEVLTADQKRDLRSVLGGPRLFWQQQLTRGQLFKSLGVARVLVRARRRSAGWDARQVAEPVRRLS